MGADTVAYGFGTFVLTLAAAWEILALGIEAAQEDASVARSSVQRPVLGGS
jgi:hypothetical protein